MKITPLDLELAASNADLLDALGYVHAGVDFLNGECVERIDLSDAPKERKKER